MSLRAALSQSFQASQDYKLRPCLKKKKKKPINDLQLTYYIMKDWLLLPKIKNMTRMFLTLFFNILAETMAIEVRQEKEIKASNWK